MCARATSWHGCVRTCPGTQTSTLSRAVAITNYITGRRFLCKSVRHRAPCENNFLATTLPLYGRLSGLTDTGEKGLDIDI